MLRPCKLLWFTCNEPIISVAWYLEVHRTARQHTNHLGVSHLLHPMLNNMHFLWHSRPGLRKYRRGAYGQLISVRSALEARSINVIPQTVVKDLERTSIWPETDTGINASYCHVGACNHTAVMKLDIPLE